MQKIRYPSLAQAIGAFVAGEFEACRAEPHRLMLDTEFAPVEKHEFTMCNFEEHLYGLLSDLVDICTLPPEGVSQCGFDATAHRGEVILCYSMADALGDDEPREWQQCAQGFVAIDCL